MKKIKLPMQALSINDLLSREQMKKVMGGSGIGSGGGNGTCTVSSNCPDVNGQQINPVSCTSDSGNCSRGTQWVECDGTYKFCGV